MAAAIAASKGRPPAEVAGRKAPRKSGFEFPIRNRYNRWSKRKGGTGFYLL
jgi:hypothetical protein